MADNNKTPTSLVQKPKRKKNEFSPESLGGSDEVGKMQTTDLISIMSALLDEKLKNMPTKSDLLEVKENINEVREDVNRLTVENKILQE